MKKVLLAYACFLFACPFVFSDEKDDAAKKAVELFLKCREVEGLEKMSDVPWCHDGNKIVKNKAELASTFKGFAKLPEVTLDFKKIGSPTEFLDNKDLAGSIRRDYSLCDVLEKTDRIVYVNIKLKGKGTAEAMFIGVKFTKDGAKIVGIVD